MIDWISNFTADDYFQLKMIGIIIGICAAPIILIFSVLMAVVARINERKRIQNRIGQLKR